MSKSKYQNRIRNVLLAIIPGLIVVVLIFAANTYFDLDLGKVVIDQVTRIVQDLEVLTGKIFGKNSAALFLGAEDQNIWLIGTTTASAYIKRGTNQYVICDASGNCLEGGTGSYIGGLGSQNYLAKFLSSSTLATSTIYELNGNIGIGTTTPSAKLTVEGDISLNGDLQIQGNRTISGSGTLIINPTGNLYLQTTNSYIDDSGNLIFGTGKYVEAEKLQFSGNIIISPNSASGNTQVQILNSDGSYVADLIVEGDIQVSGGKITLASGETIDAESTDQITINSDGITIVKSGGNEILRISSLGAKITGSATTTDTLYITSGGAQITGNVNINSGNILVSGTGEFQTSPLTIGKILLSDSGLSASRTFTFPDISDEIVTKNATQTLTQKTISTGSTWQGNIISTQYGGTGQNWSSVSTGSLPYFSAIGTMATLPIGDSGTILTSSGTLPQWQSLASLSILTGSGTENYIPKWTGNLSLATSTIYELNGNIGIGTTTPAFKLTVDGDLYVSATSTLGSATSTPVIFGGYIQSNIIPFSDATYTLGAQGYRWANLYAATTTIGDTIIIGSNTFEGTATTTLFTSGNSNQLVLGANGLVGIGTMAPSQKLTVAGNIGIQAGTNAFVGTLDNYALSLRTNNTDRIFITADGNVGIGTTTPAYTLDVNGNLRVTGTTTFGGVTYTWPSNYGQLGYFLKSLGTGEIVWAPIEGAVQGSGVANRAAFWISASELSYDDNFVWDNTNKRLGIGTTSPGSRLEVRGSTSDNTASALNVTNSEGTSLLYVRNDGNVGIGTTAPGRRLDVLDATNPQTRLSYSGSIYAELRVDSAGNLYISTNPTGKDIQVNDNNLRICSGGSCPSPQYSGYGNLQIENCLQIGNTAPMCGGIEMGKLALDKITNLNWIVAELNSTERTTQSTSYVKLKETRIDRAFPTGSSFQLCVSYRCDTSFGGPDIIQFRKNGNTFGIDSAYGCSTSYVEFCRNTSTSVSQGDLLQVWGRVVLPATQIWVKDFWIYGNGNIDWPTTNNL